MNLNDVAGEGAFLSLPIEGIADAGTFTRLTALERSLSGLIKENPTRSVPD